MPIDTSLGTPADRIAVVPLDPDRVTEQDVAEVHRVIAAATVADLPGDPVPTMEEIAGRLRARRTDRRRVRWVARTGDGIIGQGLLGLPDLDNPHLGLVTLTVHPDHRRRGIGSALLRAALGALVAEGRRSLLAEAHEGSAGEAFCRALGLRPMQTERRSLLRLAAVDWADVEAAATAAHPGYRLVAWVGRCPDDLVDRFAVAKAAMNDAPTGDMDFSDLVYNATTVRQDEEQFRALGGQYRVLAALHEATGEVAGFTEVTVPREPHRSLQEDTAVVRAHRGSGLGLWVKAAMLLRLRAERPDVAELLTGNAAGNEHMLRINRRLGFQPYDTVVEWQGDVATLAHRLG